MKAVTVFLFLIGVTESVYSQRHFFANGVDVCSPESTLKSSANQGFGIGFRYEYAATARFQPTLTFAGMFFKPKTTVSQSLPQVTTKTELDMAVLQAGAKYYLSVHPNRRFFVFAETGIHISMATKSIDGKDASPPNETDFSYSLGIGYHFGRFTLAYKEQWILANDGPLRYSDIGFYFFLTKNKILKMN